MRLLLSEASQASLLFAAAKHAFTLLLQSAGSSETAPARSARGQRTGLRQIGISFPSLELRLAKQSQLGKMELEAIRFGGYLGLAPPK